MQAPQYTITASSRNAPALELWRQRELVYFFVWRDIAIKYKQTALGVGWAIVQPFLAMVVFTLLFGAVAGLPSDDMPYPVFYFAGLTMWTFFSTGLVAAGNSLVSSSNLLTKVYFPRSALPIAAVLVGLLDYAISSIVLLLLVLGAGIGITWQTAIAPLLIIPVVAATLGGGLLLSALNVKYRDVKYTLPFLIQLWLFASPVIYPLSMFPERYRLWMALNPVAGPIEALRATVLGRPVDWPLLIVSCAVSAGMVWIGWTVFSRSERKFADLI
jgi:lipopolysaccharide transport system permease protein